MNKIKVTYDSMYLLSSVRPVPKGQVIFSKVGFEFSEEWNGLDKIAMFVQGEKTLNVRLDRDECYVPFELEVGIFEIYVRGYKADSEIIATANGVTLEVVEGAPEGGVPPVPPTQDLYGELLAELKSAEGNAILAGDKAVASATNAKQSEDNASASATNASQSAEQAKQSADNAKTSEGNAKASETNAETSETQSSKNLADLLAVIGTSIPSLVDGLIPLKYIPATATVETYEVKSESELVSLVAQRGDIAELVEDVNGEKTITKTWQLLGNDASVRDNWVVWGTSYAVQSGSATIAETANNAERINNMRLVTMNYSDFETAVKDAETLYAVDMEA